MADDELGWKQLEKLPEKLKTAAYEAVSEVTEEKAKEVYSALSATTPVGKGIINGITKNSLKIEKVDSKSIKSRTGEVVGYKVVYDGYRPLKPNGDQGRPNQVVANSLNRGWYLPNGKYVPGTYFIDKAVSKLRGMDRQIDEKFDKKLEKIKLGEK